MNNSGLYLYFGLESKINSQGAVVVAQLDEQLLPRPEIRGSILVIGNFANN